MKAFLLSATVLLTFIITGCQQPGSNTAASNTEDSVKTTAPLPAGPQCFTRVSGKDTAYIQFETTDQAVNGQLEYNLFEKDRNKGSITGTINDNIIEVAYQYMSEGTMSTRPAVFKLDGDNVYEALADKLDEEGQPVFDKDHSKLRFDSHPFVKSDCR